MTSSRSRTPAVLFGFLLALAGCTTVVTREAPPAPTVNTAPGTSDEVEEADAAAEASSPAVVADAARPVDAAADAKGDGAPPGPTCNYDMVTPLGTSESCQASAIPCSEECGGGYLYSCASAGMAPVGVGGCKALRHDGTYSSVCCPTVTCVRQTGLDTLCAGKRGYSCGQAAAPPAGCTPSGSGEYCCP